MHMHDQRGPLLTLRTKRFMQVMHQEFVIHIGRRVPSS